MSRNSIPGLTFLFLFVSVALRAQVGALLWSDEFNADGLPDSTKWSYEKGFVRGGEFQYYTAGRSVNAVVAGGKLRITCRKEPFPNAAFVPGDSAWNRSRDTASYTSASIHTFKKMGFLYGRIEARAKLPRGRGTWPAIWLLGENIGAGWPECGEIDIMEAFGAEPKAIYATLHYAGPDGKDAPAGKKRVRKHAVRGFHTYAIDWGPDLIVWYFDGREYFRFETEPAGETFRKPFYLIMNLAFGSSWAPQVDDAALPQQFLVDYVRYYALPQEGAR